MRTIRQVVGLALYVVMLLVAFFLVFFAGVGSLVDDGSVVGGLISLVLGGLLAAFSIVRLRRRRRAHIVGGESAFGDEVPSPLTTVADSEVRRYGAEPPYWPPPPGWRPEVEPADETQESSAGGSFPRTRRHFAWLLGPCLGLLLAFLFVGSSAHGHHIEWLASGMFFAFLFAAVVGLFLVVCLISPRAFQHAGKLLSFLLEGLANTNWP